MRTAPCLILCNANDDEEHVCTSWRYLILDWTFSASSKSLSIMEIIPSAYWMRKKEKKMARNTEKGFIFLIHFRVLLMLQEHRNECGDTSFSFRKNPFSVRLCTKSISTNVQLYSLYEIFSRIRCHRSRSHFHLFLFSLSTYFSYSLVVLFFGRNNLSGFLKLFFPISPFPFYSIRFDQSYQVICRHSCMVFEHPF